VTFDYARTAATVTRLIASFGALATLLRRADAAYDPATGTTSPVVSSHNVVAVVMAYDQRAIDGTLIRQGDSRAYLDCTVVPRQDDKLLWQGAELTVIAVRPLSPAGTPVLFEAQLRG
jgi:hypothetical protein